MEKQTVKDRTRNVLQDLFNDCGYQDFLNVIADRETEIEKIDVRPVTCFEQSIIEEENIDLFLEVYRNIKCYLETKDEYLPKMQEGMALCISKIAMLNYFCPSRLDYYFKLGDRSTSNGRGRKNPFEEFARLILFATRKEYWANDFNDKNLLTLSFSKIKSESNSFLDIATRALDKTEIDKIIITYSEDNIIDYISEDLEKSDISSDSPNNASRKENREVLNRQFDQLMNFYTSKIEQQALIIGGVSQPFQTKLLTQFENGIVYAKRNIGVYETTKQLKKTD